MRKIAALILLLLVSLVGALATTKTWIGDVDTDWNDPLNWDGDVLPITGDSIIIDLGSYTIAPTISTSSSFSPASITVDNVAVLIIDADITITGEIDVDNGSTLDLTGGTISLGDHLTVDNGSTATVSTVLTQTGGDDDIRIRTGSSVEVQTGAVITGFNDIDFLDTTTSVASFSQTGGTVTIDDDVKIDNGEFDIFSVSGGIFNLSDAFRITENNTTVSFTGTSDVNITGTFRFGPPGGPGVDNATLTISDDADVDISDDFRLYGGGTGGNFTISDDASLEVGDILGGDISLVSVDPTSTFTEGGVSLPVILTKFSAEVKNDYVLLNWTTASEINNDFFIIEKSQNAIDFNSIAKIKGNGTSNKPINYSYTDFGANNHDTYYRLKQIDYDGSYEYSDIILVSFHRERRIELFPNPVTDVVQIRLNNSLVRNDVTVIDIKGKEVIKESFSNSNEATINLSSLKKGIYFLKLVSIETIQIGKVIKN